MESFPLFTLNSVNLEKILRKVHPRSFRRLQQTSKRVEELVQQSPNISVRAPEKFFLKMSKNTSGPSHSFYFTHIDIFNKTQRVEEDGLLASRLGTLRFPDFFSQIDVESFESLCGLLKKYRISCDELIIPYSNLTKEETEKLLAILKPIKINLNSFESNRFEALFQSRTLKEVTVSVDFDYIEGAVTRALPSWHTVNITSQLWVKFKERTRDMTVQIQQVQTVKKLLVSQPWPNLRRFYFALIWWLPGFLTSEEEAEFLKDCTAKVNEDNEQLQKWLEDYPRGTSCTVSVRRTGFHGETSGIIDFCPSNSKK